MRVDWCVSSWFRIKNTHSLTATAAEEVDVLPGEPQGARRQGELESVIAIDPCS